MDGRTDGRNDRRQYPSAPMAAEGKMCHKFEEQDKVPRRIGVSQKISLYLLWWLCIYSGLQTGHNKILILS